MKTLTVRLPDPLVAEIEAESKQRRVSKSDVVRERLRAMPARAGTESGLEGIADLVGAVRGLPADLSDQKKKYLKTTGYGAKRPR